MLAVAVTLAAAPARFGRAQPTAPPDSAQAEAPPKLDADVAFETGTTRIRTDPVGTTRYLTASLAPEFSYRAVHVGFLFTLRVDRETGRVRREDFDSAADYLALVHFLQVGERDEAGWYGRFGALDDLTLGYGGLIADYTNTVRLDDPQRGLDGAYRGPAYTGEAMWGQLTDPGVFGLRGALRPFAADSTSRMRPVAFGLSIAGDLDQENAYINPVDPGRPFYRGSRPFIPGALAFPLAEGRDEGALLLVGADVGFPVVAGEAASLLAYAEVAKIIGHGSGAAIGTRGRWPLGGRTRMEARLELQFLGPEYLPRYFGPLYEVEKLRRVEIPVNGDDLVATTSKRNRLAGRDEAALGSHVSFAARLARTFRLQTSYERVWTEEASGWFRIDLRTEGPALPFYARFSYDRFNIDTLGDALRPEREASLFRVAFAYRLFRVVLLGFDIRQSFEPTFERGVAVGQAKQVRLEPHIGLALR